jgi:hypothetical protein
VVVDAFFKPIQHRHAQGRRQMNFDLLNGIRCAGCVESVNGHDEF